MCSFTRYMNVDKWFILIVFYVRFLMTLRTLKVSFVLGRVLALRCATLLNCKIRLSKSLRLKGIRFHPGKSIKVEICDMWYLTSIPNLKKKLFPIFSRFSNFSTFFNFFQLFYSHNNKNQGLKSSSISPLETDLYQSCFFWQTEVIIKLNSWIFVERSKLVIPKIYI